MRPRERKRDRHRTSATHLGHLGSESERERQSEGGRDGAFPVIL